MAYEVRLVEIEGANVPDAEVGDDGVIHVTYHKEKNIYYVNSKDAGASFSRPIRVNTEAGFAHGGLYRGPDIALGKDGRVHVIWYNDSYAQGRPTDEWGIMYTRMKVDGSKFETSRNLNKEPSDNYSLAADGAGRLTVMWTKGGLFIRQSDDDGASFGEKRQLKADPCECCATRLLYSTAGNLYYLYRDKKDNQRDMYLGVLDNGGDTTSLTMLNADSWYFNACPMSGNFLSWGSDELLSAWELKGGVHVSRLDTAGHLLAPGSIEIVAQAKYPAVLEVTDGFLVAWKQGRDLYWRQYDSQLQAIYPAHRMKAGQVGRPAAVETQQGDVLLFP